MMRGAESKAGTPSRTIATAQIRAVDSGNQCGGGILAASFRLQKNRVWGRECVNACYGEAKN
jgi:hypothetical protein